MLAAVGILAAGAGQAAAFQLPEPTKALSRCPKIAGETPSVFALGSSTMGWPLGDWLVEVVKGWGGKAARWGVASSGLARPDFHDWPGSVPQVVDKYDPDIWVVNLGGNDGQGIKTGKRNRSWVHFKRDRWKTIYAERVDKMLDLMSGPDRSKTIIWFGPVAIGEGKAYERGRIINRIQRERVEAFEGRAYFIDLFDRTVTKKGERRWRFRPPGSKKRERLRGRDGIHLTRIGTRWLMLNPLLKLLEPCLADGRTWIPRPPDTPERPTRLDIEAPEPIDSVVDEPDTLDGLEGEPDTEAPAASDAPEGGG